MITVKQANKITGGLTITKKLPCRSFSLPASACIAGSRLATLRTSPCYDCYAKRGSYVWPNVRKAQQQRLKNLSHPQWVEAMVFLIKRYSPDYFRWFDSGDIQDMEMLNKMFEVARQTPETKHWVPTQERRMVKNIIPPQNMVIRVSSPVYNVPLISSIHIHASMVMHNPDSNLGYICPATTIRKTCDTCRACWDPNIDNIIYRKH